MSYFLPSSWSKKRKVEDSNDSSRPIDDNNNSAHYFAEDGQRRSQRVGEATHSAQRQLALRTEELKKEREKNQRVERTFESLRTHHDNIKKERDGLKRNKKWFAERYDWIVENALRPYARSRGTRFGGDDESLQETVLSILHDATDAKTLRKEARQLELKASNAGEAEELSRNLKHALQANKILHQQNQTLQKERADLRRMQKQMLSLQKDAEEVTHLRDQVQKLQMDAMAKLEKVQAVPDDQFTQDFHAIVALVKTLTRTVCTSNDTNIFDVCRGGILLEDVPTSFWKTRAQKKCFLEAWIWSALYAYVFASPFAIFSDDGNLFDAAWTKGFGVNNVPDWPVPSTESESWRRTTMKQMVEVAERSVIAQGESAAGRLLEEHAAQGLQQSVVRCRARAAETIGSALSMLAPTSDTSQVQELIDKAFTLGMEMALQRACLRVVYPDVGVNFNKEQMSSMPDRSGEDIDDGIVAVVVNPGLAKWGDPEGRNYDCRYDIVPSLVQLKPFSASEPVEILPDEVVIKDEPGLIEVESED